MSHDICDKLNQLCNRAVELHALLERHPGRALLAEYEAELVDREDVLFDRINRDLTLESYVNDLLSRMEQEILTIETGRA